MKNLDTVKHKLKIIDGDICNQEAVINACHGQEMVCHLAYVNGTRFFYEKPELVLNVALRGMLNILDGCKHHGVKEFIYASSSEVYQTPPVLPTPEDVPMSIPDIHNPRYSYGGGKIMGELLTLHDARKWMDRVIIFRPHNVFGPAMGHEHVIPELVKKVVVAKQEGQGELCIELKGDGSQTRAFIFVDQFIDALTYVMKNGIDGEIYHLGSEEEITIHELNERIAKILKTNVKTLSSEAPAGETSRRCADINKLRSLGYDVTFDMENGLQDTVRWYEQYYKDRLDGT